MKMNKKGFTLIEMLVVIAIIAVLVSIIIPVVSSSTVKAEAAATAANLRSIKAEIITDMLTANKGATAVGASGHWSISKDSTGKVTDVSKVDTYILPFDDAGKFAQTLATDGSTVTVTYDSKNIDTWAKIAETGSES